MNVDEYADSLELRRAERAMAGEPLPPEKPRFCIDCKHHEHLENWGHICLRPIVNVVTGEPIERTLPNGCYEQRNHNYSAVHCGREAHYFEAKS